MTELARPSSVRKHQAILEAAEQIFLRDGYLGANMDELAALSQVSKQTVYNHFGSKEALFIELVSTMTTLAGNQVHEEVPDPAAADELPTFLENYAERQLNAVLTPRILQLRRLVIYRVGAAQDFGRGIGRVLESAGDPQARAGSSFVVAMQYVHAVGAPRGCSVINFVVYDRV